MLAGSLESIGRREINKKYETNYSLPKLGKLPSKKKLIVKDTLIKEGEESSCKKNIAREPETGSTIWPDVGLLC